VSFFLKTVEDLINFLKQLTNFSAKDGFIKLSIIEKIFKGGNLRNQAFNPLG
jgi:hypothetical protein